MENVLSFQLACQIMRTSGRWIDAKSSDEYQAVVARTVCGAFCRLKRLYETRPSIDKEAALKLDWTFSNALARAAYWLFSAIASSSATRYTDIACSSAIPLAFTMWANHYADLEEESLPHAATYLGLVRFDREHLEETDRALLQVFGSYKDCALSFVFVLHRIYKSGINILERSKTMDLIFDFLTRCSTTTHGPGAELRNLLRRYGASTMACSLLPKIQHDIQQSLDNYPYGEEVLMYIQALTSCLQFLYTTFDAYDAELWAIGPVRKGLLSNLYSLESLLPYIPSEFDTFKTYQWVLYRLVVLARGERFYRLLSTKLMLTWRKEGSRDISSDRQLFEAEFHRTALIRRRTQKHISPFQLICNNVS